MDILKYKDYEGTAELDIARGICRGKILFIDDLVTYESKFPGKLQKEFKAAVDDYLETCAAVGKEPQRPLRGLFNVRVAPGLHRAATLRAVSDGVSLNEIVARALDAFVNVKTGANSVGSGAIERPVVTKKAIGSVGLRTTWIGSHENVSH